MICFDSIQDLFPEFLGPVVNELNYWGTKERTGKQNYEFK